MPTERNKQVVVLSHHVLCRRAMTDVLAQRYSVVDCATFAQLSAAARTPHQPVAVIIDLDHSTLDGWTLYHDTELLFPHSRIIPLGSALRQAAALDAPELVGIETARAEPSAFTRLTAPRRPSPELARLLRLWQRVTPRQRVVMRHLAVGHDNRTIAHELRIGERAVKAHVSALLAMFALDHRTELALLAAAAGLRPVA